MPKFTVYVKRYFDDEVIEKTLEGLTSREVQALRVEEHLLPGELIEFDAMEVPIGLVRTPMKRTTSNLKRTTPLPKVSEKRKVENRVRAKMMVDLAKRDDYKCQAQHLFGTNCFGDLHGHEVLKKSRGGSRTDPGNVILCCDKHNGDVEDHPRLAEALGLSLPSRK